MSEPFPRDDLGTPVAVVRPARRVVSLVPSLTESLVSARAEAVVGATDWCTHPGDLDVARVRGTKNPDLRAVAGLAPDLVVANREENRELDVRRLREAGIAVWVTVTESVPGALDALDRLFDLALGWEPPGWLSAARDLWAGPLPPVRGRVAVPVWRDPWMVVGRDTFTGDLLRRLGLANAYADHSDRYPTVEPAEITRGAVDLVILPDEPYPFSPTDGPDVFVPTPTALVSGRMLTWYGPSLVQAHDLRHTLLA